MKLTTRNIEDWDFRGVEPGSEADIFLVENYTEVIGVEGFRLHLIQVAVQHEIAALSDDREYIVVNPGKEGFFQGICWVRLRDWLTSEGRFEARVKRSVLRESKKYGRVKVRLRSNEQELEQYRQTIGDVAAVHREWHLDDDVPSERSESK